MTTSTFHAATRTNVDTAAAASNRFRHVYRKTLVLSPLDVETCTCGEPAEIVDGFDAWCADCVPVDLQRDLDADREYDALRDAR